MQTLQDIGRLVARGRRRLTDKTRRAAFARRVCLQAYKRGHIRELEALRTSISSRKEERRKNRGGRHTRQPLRSAVSKKRTLQNKAFVHFTLRADSLGAHRRPIAKPNRRSDRQKATKPASPTVNRDKAKRSPPTRAEIQQAIS